MIENLYIVMTRAWNEKVMLINCNTSVLLRNNNNRMAIKNALIVKTFIIVHKRLMETW